MLFAAATSKLSVRLTALHSASSNASEKSIKRLSLIIGLLERRNRTVWGMGVDSLLVLIAYVAGLTGLYYLR